MCVRYPKCGSSLTLAYYNRNRHNRHLFVLPFVYFFLIVNKINKETIKFSWFAYVFTSVRVRSRARQQAC